MKITKIALFALMLAAPFAVLAGKSKTLYFGDLVLEPDTDMTFSVEDAPEEINGMPVLDEYLPEGLSVTWTGKKFKVPKSKKVKYSKKEEDFVSKADENCCSFKVSINKKTGVVKGSFKVYVVKSEKKLKTYGASFRGSLGDAGLTVTYKGAGLTAAGSLD